MASRYSQRLERLEARSDGERGFMVALGPMMLAKAISHGRPCMAAFAIAEDGDYSQAPIWVREERRCTQAEWMEHHLPSHA